MNNIQNSIKDFNILEIINESRLSVVLRAQKKSTSKIVIIKFLKAESVAPEMLELMTHEFEMLSKIHTPLVIKPIELLSVSDNHFPSKNLLLVMENFPSETLESYMKRENIDIINSLNIAIKLAEAIGEIHYSDIIHKDIKPSNILINEKTKELKVIDFGNSAFLSRKTLEIRSAVPIQGTIDYISPEQTGRLNIPIDYRTDLYSLGITLYELFTKALPFKGESPQDIIHAHIAHTPVPPKHLNPEIPQALSDIILKCLEKMPENRYHSAFGLKKDLENCLDRLSGSRQNFSLILAEHDIYDHFHFPEKLYGREAEISLIHRYIEKIEKEQTHLLSISGYSGVGKSSLISEAVKSYTSKGGRYATANYDQYSQNVPYSAWIQASEQIIQSILASSDQKLMAWKNRLNSALEGKGQVIADLIPQIELIIGKQPQLEKLNPNESENRFLYTILIFIKTLISSEEPLVIFFDNVQWADQPSLKLLSSLLQEKTSKNLLIIIAYRDNEVDSFHPLRIFFNEVESKDVKVEHLHLNPLPINYIKEFIQDAFYGPPVQTEGLSELVIHRTQGNPFFMLRFLKHLYENKYFYFDKENYCWLADLNAISHEQLSDNVADLLIRDMRLFNPEMVNLLKVCSVMGEKFTLRMIMLITHLSESKITSLLEEAIKEDLIDRDVSFRFDRYSEKRKNSLEGEKSQYHFLHDRIQQAFNMLLSGDEKMDLHYRIGFAIWESTPTDKIQERCIEIVNHLNEGPLPPENSDLRNRLFKLNLMAGIKAKGSAAYSQAIVYFNRGISLLGKDCWERFYETTHSLYINLALCLRIMGGSEEPKALYDLCLSKAKNSLEKADIYFQMITLDSQLKNYNEALSNAAKGVEALGFPIDLNPSIASVIKELIKFKLKVLFRKAEDFEKLPRIENPHVQQAARIISALMYPLFVTGNGNLFFTCAFKLIEFTLQYGLMQQSSTGFLSYAVIAASLKLNDYKGSSSYGLAGFHMAQMYPKSEESAGGFVVYYTLVHRWSHLLETAIEPLRNGFKRCLELGQLNYGALAAVYCSMIPLVTGKKIDAVLAEINETVKEASKFKSISEIEYIFIYREICLALQGAKEDPTDPRPPELEEEALHEPITQKNMLYRLRYDLWHAVLLYIFGKSDEAKTLCLASVESAQHYSNWIELHLYYLIFCLSLTDKMVDPHTQTPEWNILLKNYKLIKRWAKASPINYLHHELIIKAEIQRLKKYSHEKVVGSYEAAIQAAKKNGSVHEIAIAYELLGKYYISQNLPESASYILQKSLQAYAAWGAAAKCNHFKNQYADYMDLDALAITSPSERIVKASSIASSHSGLISQSQFTSGASGLAFDINTLIESLQMLSCEIALDKLMESVMHLVIVNAGADKAYLLLDDAGIMKVFAQIKVNQNYAPIVTPIDLEDLSDDLCAGVIKFVLRSKQEVLLNNAPEEGNFRSDPYILAKKTKSILCLPILYKGFLTGILYLENRITKGTFTHKRVRLLTYLSSQMAISIEHAHFYAKLESKVADRTKELSIRTVELQEKNKILAEMQSQLILQEKLKEREMLKSKFGKYVPNLKVLDIIVEKGHSLGGEEKEITALFCDIWDFSSFAENMAPKLVIDLLNQFFTEMVNIATKHQGMIDKFVGDQIMILFGALEPDKKQAQHAVEAAREMISKLREINDRHLIKYAPRLTVGIGINTGRAVMGSLGSEERLEYTAIGDSINIASRLENLTRKMKTPNGILISEGTRCKLDPSIQVQDKGKVRVKGKAEEVQVYQVL